MICSVTRNRFPIKNLTMDPLVRHFCGDYLIENIFYVKYRQVLLKPSSSKSMQLFSSNWTVIFNRVNQANVSDYISRVLPLQHLPGHGVLRTGPGQFIGQHVFSVLRSAGQMHHAAAVEGVEVPAWQLHRPQVNCSVLEERWTSVKFISYRTWAFPNTFSACCYSSRDTADCLLP